MGGGSAWHIEVLNTTRHYPIKIVCEVFETLENVPKFDCEVL